MLRPNQTLFKLRATLLTPQLPSSRRNGFRIQLSDPRDLDAQLQAQDLAPAV